MKNSTIAKRRAAAASGNARFMRPRDYADHVGVSERTVRLWLAENRIPFIGVGKRMVLIDPIKADRALERFEQKELVL